MDGEEQRVDKDTDGENNRAIGYNYDFFGR